jgi:hypothetical protein
MAIVVDGHEDDGGEEEDNEIYVVMRMRMGMPIVFSMRMTEVDASENNNEVFYNDDGDFDDGDEEECNRDHSDNRVEEEVDDDDGNNDDEVQNYRDYYGGYEKVIDVEMMIVMTQGRDDNNDGIIVALSMLRKYSS